MVFEFLKLPMLVAHFIEHKKQNNNITFWGFLCMHYSNQNSNHTDYDKDDMKLPFKSHESCPIITFIAVVPEINTSILNKPIFFEAKSFVNYADQFCTADFLSTIWQPPKFC
jgi:hypothetical protein